MLVVCPEALGELKIDRFANLRVEEGAEDVEAIQDHAFLGSEGQNQVDGLGVDGGGVGVPDGLPFQVAECDESGLALCHVPHRIDLRLEVHLALE